MSTSAGYNDKSKKSYAAYQSSPKDDLKPPSAVGRDLQVPSSAEGRSRSRSRDGTADLQVPSSADSRPRTRSRDWTGDKKSTGDLLTPASADGRPRTRVGKTAAGCMDGRKSPTGGDKNKSSSALGAGARMSLNDLSKETSKSKDNDAAAEKKKSKARAAKTMKALHSSPQPLEAEDKEAAAEAADVPGLMRPISASTRNADRRKLLVRRNSSDLQKELGMEKPTIGDPVPVLKRRDSYTKQMAQLALKAGEETQETDSAKKSPQVPEHCIVQDCTKPAAKDRLCAEHFKEDKEGAALHFKKESVNYILERSKQNDDDKLSALPAKRESDLSKRENNRIQLTDKEGQVKKWTLMRKESYKLMCEEVTTQIDRYDAGEVNAGKTEKFTLPKTLSEAMTALNACGPNEPAKAAVVIFATLLAWSNDTLNRNDKWRTISAMLDKSQTLLVPCDGPFCYENREVVDIDRDRMSELMQDCPHVLRSYVKGTKSASAQCSIDFLLPPGPVFELEVTLVDDFAKTSKVVMLHNSSAGTKYPRSITIKQDALTKEWRVFSFWNIFRFVQA